MSRSDAETSIAKLDAPSRAVLAKEKITKVVDRISELLALAEHNALIVYSPLLSSQIPRSFAANAFRIFQKTMHKQEIIQLCALWDKPDGTLAHNSILTVHALVNDADVVNLLAAETQGFWNGLGARIYTPPDEPELEAEIEKMVAESNREQGERQARNTRVGLIQLLQQISDTAESSLFASVKNIRDKHLAHALDETRAEKKLGPIAPMKYGDEQKLLAVTTEVIENLYLFVTGKNFNLKENREMHGRYAKELWNGCTFTIQGR